MTKEQFYRNCLTSEGKEQNEQEFNDLKSLKQYYKKDIDTQDISKWDEIIYIPKYGKINIFDKETYELLPQEEWEIYTFFDILKIIYTTNNKKSLNELYEMAKDIYKRLPNEDILEYLSDNIINNYINTL